MFEIAGQVYWWMAIHATLYGFFGGCYVAINSIVLIDMVGLKLMPKALGVVLLIQGLGAAIGQPLEGKVILSLCHQMLPLVSSFLFIEVTKQSLCFHPF